jgi:hypothetical protein
MRMLSRPWRTLFPINTDDLQPLRFVGARLLSDVILPLGPIEVGEDVPVGNFGLSGEILRLN